MLQKKEVPLNKVIYFINQLWHLSRGDCVRLYTVLGSRIPGSYGPEQFVPKKTWSVRGATCNKGPTQN